MLNFSVAVIARNEEKTLPRLLRSLEEFKKRGGEVVILDTGSTDNTAKVARDWGCKVEEVGDKFRITIDNKTAKVVNKTFIVEGEEPILKGGDTLFDFASARNYAANLCSNSMVSMPDADEEFTALDIDRIQNEINNGADQIEFNFVFDHDAAGREIIKFIQCKFFNRDKMKWVNKIHEVLQGNTNKRIFLDENILKIEHWQNQETNRSSYLKGLALDCFLNPANDRNCHYFGRELIWCGRHKSAIQELKRHLSISWWKAERSQSMIFIGDCTIDEEERLDWYHKAFLEEPNRRIGLMRLAMNFYGKDNQKCACYASAALQIPYTGFYADSMIEYREGPHELLYCALGWMGRNDESKFHYDKAYSYAPHKQKYIDDMKYYYKPGEMPSVITEGIVRPNNLHELAEQGNPHYTKYEYKDVGIDGFMSQKDLEWLYQTAKKSKSILEIGSWKGRSTHALLSGCKGTVTAVDTFKGSDDDNDLTKKMGQEQDIFAQFMNNVGSFRNLEVLKMTSKEAKEKLGDRKFDMIFIDALHTYEGVKDDISLWSDNAIVVISGHDYTPGWPGVVRAVEESLGKPDGVEDIIWWFNKKKNLKKSSQSG